MLKRKIFWTPLVILAMLLAPYPFGRAGKLSAQGQGCPGTPFTDTVGSTFCNSILMAFVTGITIGTSATTYSPTQPTLRDQMSAFTTRTLSQALLRSRRGALGRWYTPKTTPRQFTVMPGAGNATWVAPDGADLWVSAGGTGEVHRVRASDGKVLETWTGATQAWDILAVEGRVYISGQDGSLYSIDPRLPAGAVTTIRGPGFFPAASAGMVFDGEKIWRAALGPTWSTFRPDGSDRTNVGPSSGGDVRGISYDGANVWLISKNRIAPVNGGPGTPVSFPSSLGDNATYPVFDGANIVIPDNINDRVLVFRPANSTFTAILTGNGLNRPFSAAFDGERVAVTNANGVVSLFRAIDYTPLGTVALTTGVLYGICSDGINFWVMDASNDRLYRL